MKKGVCWFWRRVLRRRVGRRTGGVRRAVRVALRAVRALADVWKGVGGAHDLRPAGAFRRGAGGGVGGEPGLHKPDHAVAYPDGARRAEVQARGAAGLLPDKAWGVVRD